MFLLWVCFGILSLISQLRHERITFTGPVIISALLNQVRLKASPPEAEDINAGLAPLLSVSMWD